MSTHPKMVRPGKPGKVRPTTGKVLESLMAILAPDSEGARALDLFAGTGEMGIRLLGIGVSEVTFLEADAKVAAALRDRLKKVDPSCRVLVGNIPKTLDRLKGKFSLILADPPYDWDKPKTLLPALTAYAEAEAILVVEHHHKTVYDDSGGWTLYRQQKYGETRLSFFRFTSDQTAATCESTLRRKTQSRPEIETQ